MWFEPNNNDSVVKDSRVKRQFIRLSIQFSPTTFLFWFDQPKIVSHLDPLANFGERIIGNYTHIEKVFRVNLKKKKYITRFKYR